MIGSGGGYTVFLKLKTLLSLPLFTELPDLSCLGELKTEMKRQTNKFNQKVD